MKNNDMYTAHNRIVRLQERVIWLASMGGEQWDAQGGDVMERQLSDMKREYDAKYLVWA